MNKLPTQFDAIVEALCNSPSPEEVERMQDEAIRSTWTKEDADAFIARRGTSLNDVIKLMVK